nr:MAG TPA: hypothetical protein [Caudoviricetes sp.]
MSLTGFLSYSRVNWQQSPSKSTPLSATNLNIMDAGIKNNNDMISNLRDEVTQLNSNLTMSLLAYDNVTKNSTSIEYDVYNNRAGIYIQIMTLETGDTEKIKGYPKGIYGYGTLITIMRQAGMYSAEQWRNAQIYIPHNGKMVYRTLANSKWQCVDGTTIEIQR